MNETVTKTDGHYQAGLPWRNRLPSIQNNRGFTESRLCSLKRGLLKGEELHGKYNATMNEYLSKGHAVNIPPRELSVEGTSCIIQLSTPGEQTRFVLFLIVPPNTWVRH